MKSFPFLYIRQSFSQSFDLVLEDPWDGFQVSHAPSAGALTLLDLLGPSVFAGASSRISAGSAGVILFMVTHAATSSA